MKKFLCKYSYEFILVLIYTLTLCVCSPLDVTQFNLGDKSSGFLYEAVSLDITGRSPLYSFLGWIVTRLPMRDSLVMSLFLSIIPAILSVAFVYVIVKSITNNRTYALFGMIFLMTNAIFFLQAQKIEPYCLVAFVFILGYYFVLKKSFVVSSIIFGLSCIIHPLIIVLITAVVMRHSEMRKLVWIVLLIPAITYGAILIASNLDSMKVINNLLGSSSLSFVFYKLLYFLASTIWIWSFGFVPFIFLMFKRDEFFIYGIYFLFFAFGLIISSYPGVNHMAIVAPMLAVMSGVGMKYINFKRVIMIGSCLVFVLLIVFFNIRFKDNVGGITSARSILNDLNNIEKDAYVVTNKFYNNSIFRDGYYVTGAIKYINYTQNKQIVALDDRVYAGTYYYFNVINKNNLYSELIREENVNINNY